MSVQATWECCTGDDEGEHSLANSARALNFVVFSRACPGSVLCLWRSLGLLGASNGIGSAFASLQSFENVLTHLYLGAGQNHSSLKAGRREGRVCVLFLDDRLKRGLLPARKLPQHGMSERTGCYYSPVTDRAVGGLGLDFGARQRLEISFPGAEDGHDGEPGSAPGPTISVSELLAKDTYKEMSKQGGLFFFM